MSAAAGMGGDYAKQQLDEMYKQTTGMDVPADRSWANEEIGIQALQKARRLFKWQRLI